MKDWRSQAHVKWECKYHVVIVPKYRRRRFYGSLRSEIGKILRDLCRQKEIELVKGNALPDHVHLLLSVPPKYSEVAPICRTLQVLSFRGYTKAQRSVQWQRSQLAGSVVRVVHTAMR
jgi:putative transposase